MVRCIVGTTEVKRVEHNHKWQYHKKKPQKAKERGPTEAGERNGQRVARYIRKLTKSFLYTIVWLIFSLLDSQRPGRVASGASGRAGPHARRIAAAAPATTTAWGNKKCINRKQKVLIFGVKICKLLRVIDPS